MPARFHYYADGAGRADIRIHISPARGRAEQCYYYALEPTGSRRHLDSLRRTPRAIILARSPRAMMHKREHYSCLCAHAAVTTHLDELLVAFSII